MLEFYHEWVGEYGRRVARSRKFIPAALLYHVF